MRKILLIEDDNSLGMLLTDFLEAEGKQVKLCKDGRTGLDAALNENFDLAIIDVMLPKVDGYTIANTLRDEDLALPFLFLTARSMKEDKLKGYDLGAEDYITKPFEEEELLAKINVILRRMTPDNKQNPTTKFKIGKYAFDYTRQELIFHDKVQRLTQKENEVLRLLCLNKNQILKREEAVEKIYGKKDYFLGRSFDVFISKIRKLLKNDPNLKIENVFKVGFILSEKE